MPRVVATKCVGYKIWQGGCHNVCGNTKYGKEAATKCVGIQNMVRRAATKCVGIQNMVTRAGTKCVGIQNMARGGCHKVCGNTKYGKGVATLRLTRSQIWLQQLYIFLTRPYFQPYSLLSKSNQKLFRKGQLTCLTQANHAKQWQLNPFQLCLPFVPPYPPPITPPN